MSIATRALAETMVRLEMRARRQVAEFKYTSAGQTLQEREQVRVQRSELLREELKPKYPPPLS